VRFLTQLLALTTGGKDELRTGDVFFMLRQCEDETIVSTKYYFVAKMFLKPRLAICCSASRCNISEVGCHFKIDVPFEFCTSLFIADRMAKANTTWSLAVLQHEPVTVGVVNVKLSEDQLDGALQVLSFSGSA
jgi:hypothetical protein